MGKISKETILFWAGWLVVALALAWFCSGCAPFLEKIFEK